MSRVCPCGRGVVFCNARLRVDRYGRGARKHRGEIQSRKPSTRGPKSDHPLRITDERTKYIRDDPLKKVLFVISGKPCKAKSVAHIQCRVADEHSISRKIFRDASSREHRKPRFAWCDRRMKKDRRSIKSARVVQYVNRHPELLNGKRSGRMHSFVEERSERRVHVMRFWVDRPFSHRMIIAPLRRLCRGACDSSTTARVSCRTETRTLARSDAQHSTEAPRER